MQPGNGDMTESTGTPAEEAPINISDQSYSKSDIGDEESTDTEADKIIDSDKVEAGRRKSDIPEQMTGKSPPSEGVDLAKWPLKKRATTVIAGQNQKLSVRSRYRGTSAGSCHDFCKYGHSHEPFKKTKRPFMETVRESRPLTRTASGANIASSVLDKEIQNKPILRRLSLPGVISSKDRPKIPAEMYSSETVTPTQSKKKKVQSEMKPSSVGTPGKSFSRIKIDIPDVTKTAGRSTNSQKKSNQKGKEMKTEGSVSCKNRYKEKAKEPMNNSPRTALKKSPSIKALLVKNLKSFSRSRRLSNSEESKINGSSDAPDSTVNMVEPNNKKPAEKAPLIPRGRVPKIKGVKGNLKQNRLGMSSSGAEKTSAREGETPKKSGSTKQNGTVREDGGSKSTTPRAKDTVNLKAKPTRAGSSRTEEKDGSSWMVKFRRGTVLNLQVASNSPKKLQFKRGRVLGEDLSSKATFKNLKNKGDIADGTLDNKPEHEKVHLRRQEAAVKKDSVDLNNVIEETASKLVKTRKSKVKALVGAFETVMSFRDRKPLVETSAS